METSRTSLASRTHFEVLGRGLEGQVLGLGPEASSPRKLACPRLEDSTSFWIVKILWSAWKIFWKTFFCGDRLKNFCEDLLFYFLEIAWKIFVKTFFFGEHLRLCPWSLASSIPVLGFESVCPRKDCPCPWPRIFFVSLASSLVFSTPPLVIYIFFFYSLASRTRIDAVELIVKKHLLLWWSFWVLEVTFYGLS